MMNRRVRFHLADPHRSEAFSESLKAASVVVRAADNCANVFCFLQPRLIGILILNYDLAAHLRVADAA